MAAKGAGLDISIYRLKDVEKLGDRSPNVLM